jgi:hypothetical protein
MGWLGDFFKLLICLGEIVVIRRWRAPAAGDEKGVEGGDLVIRVASSYNNHSFARGTLARFARAWPRTLRAHDYVALTVTQL